MLCTCVTGDVACCPSDALLTPCYTHLQPPWKTNEHLTRAPKRVLDLVLAGNGEVRSCCKGGFKVKEVSTACLGRRLAFIMESMRSSGDLSAPFVCLSFPNTWVWGISVRAPSHSCLSKYLAHSKECILQFRKSWGIWLRCHSLSLGLFPATHTITFLHPRFPCCTLSANCSSVWQFSQHIGVSFHSFQGSSYIARPGQKFPCLNPQAQMSLSSQRM